MFSGHGFEGRHCWVSPGQQVVEAPLRVALDDAGDDVGEVGARLDADELAGFDQRDGHQPVLSATIRAGKQGVLAIQGQGPDRALDNVGVDLDQAVVEEQAQAGPA